MKFKAVILSFVLASFALSVANAQELPRKVEDVAVLNLSGKPTNLPHFGEKALLIFYVDPDRHSQNEAFTVDMEKNNRVNSDNIYTFGIMNLDDAPMIPNALARTMARKRTETSGATVLADQDGILAKNWGLGDCNNLFTTIIISKEGEMVYLHKGEMSEEDIDNFYKVLAKYR